MSIKIVKNSKLLYIPASHEDLNDPGVWKKVLFRKDELAGGKIEMINWAKLPAGKTFKAHYHEDMDEVFIILNGKTKIYIGQEESDLEKGDAVLIPKGSVHKMSNTCGEDVEYIAIGISLGQSGQTIVKD